MVVYYFEWIVLLSSKGTIAIWLQFPEKHAPFLWSTSKTHNFCWTYFILQILSIQLTSVLLSGSWFVTACINRSEMIRYLSEILPNYVWNRRRKKCFVWLQMATLVLWKLWPNFKLFSGNFKWRLVTLSIGKQHKQFYDSCSHLN